MMEELHIDGQYYTALTESPGQEYLAAHALCTPHKCTARVDEGTYVTKHADYCDQKCPTDLSYGGNLSIADGAAEMEEEEPELDFVHSVVRIIRRGGWPIIYWDEKNSRILTGEYNQALGKTPKYIAISHV